MGTISVSLPSDGSTADVSDYNTPLTTIVDEINGNLDNANIASDAAIAGSKLADNGVGSSQLALGVPVQMVSTTSSAVATGTTTIPADDTVPQSGEGTEFLTLAVTPKSATNILVIEVTVALSSATADRYLIAALFQDATAGALAVGLTYEDTATAVNTISFRHTMVAGTASATTFKVRGGANAAATITFNGTGGARYFGAITKSSIVITEYKAA